MSFVELSLLGYHGHNVTVFFVYVELKSKLKFGLRLIRYDVQYKSLQHSVAYEQDFLLNK